jgi:signal transduction histidine kinase
MRPIPFPTGWLTGLAIGAVLAVNVAGIYGIAVARSGALEEERRAFRNEVEARARSLESRLTAVRGDLAFLATASAVSKLGEGGRDADAGERRADAQSAVLLFLRGHPEVVRVAVTSADGEPLLHAGRRGGVPLLWLAAQPTGREGAAVAPGTPRLLTRLPGDSGREELPGSTLEMEVAPAQLLQSDGRWGCELRSADGRLLARDTPIPPGSPGAPRGGAEEVAAAVTLEADGWSLPSPWTLDCQEPALTSGGRLGESVTGRFRTTLILNLGVMALALFLGGFAVQQTRRRARLEARAREEARVRELERQLLHAERLTTVGRLAAGIAHEINNPLEGMANWLSLSQQALERGQSAEAGSHLQRVKEGLERAAGTVRQVLAHADPAKTPVADLDLNEVLLEAGKFVETRKEFRGIDFVFELSDEPLTVRGSATMLGQVAVNLMLNACEAQPEVGEVRVRSHREGKSVVAAFLDRGPGVAAEDRSRIFEPFFSTKHSTGLGLSICHTIVQQHRGELTVADREGGGTVMTMRLPVAASEEGGS